jgi:hypothetical protein
VATLPERITSEMPWDRRQASDHLVQIPALLPHGNLPGAPSRAGAGPLVVHQPPGASAWLKNSREIATALDFHGRLENT